MSEAVGLLQGVNDVASSKEEFEARVGELAMKKNDFLFFLSFKIKKKKNHPNLSIT